MAEKSEMEVMVPAATPPSAVPSLPLEMSIEQVVARVQKVRELQARVMKPEIHYGTIPGTPKPTLLKPGAELLLLTFMFDPQYEHTVTQDGKHREILARCVLYHIPTGNRIASGEGSCSTYESKYAYRKASATCPNCNHDLMRSKYGDKGWYCNKNRGGCGKNFPLSAVKGSTERIENPDIADQYNTVLKMANKRALTAAILNATAASEIFTQDVEDFVDNDKSEVDERIQPKQQSRVDDEDSIGTEPPYELPTEGCLKDYPRILAAVMNQFNGRLTKMSITKVSQLKAAYPKFPASNRIEDLPIADLPKLAEAFDMEFSLPR